MILNIKRGDVNGDGIADLVYLTGTVTPDSPFIQNITIVIQDGRTRLFSTITPKENAGYSPSMFLGDFTGDNTDEIMISIASGGSGGYYYYYIYSDLNNIQRKLFDFETFNAMYQYDVTYKDNYKVEVINKTSKIRYVLDITYKGMEYLNEIYDRNGRLKAPISGWVNGLSGLYPIDFDSNGVYELLGYQQIAGRYNADGLGYVLTSLRWNGQMFNPFDQNVAVPGAAF